MNSGPVSNVFFNFIASYPLRAEESGQAARSQVARPVNSTQEGRHSRGRDDGGDRADNADSSNKRGMKLDISV